MKLLRSAVLSSVLLALAAGAGAQAPDTAPRKVLRVAFRTAETNFDPVKVDDLYSRTVTAHIFESPYAYDPLARPVKIRPLTAVGMPEVSNNFRTWVIHIQPGIYFADDPAFKGKKRELVAQDYVYAFERVLDPSNRSPLVSELLDAKVVGLEKAYEAAQKAGKFDYDQVVPGFRATDRYTLRIELEEPRPRLIEYMLAAPDLHGAVAREVVEFYGRDIDAHPVGTGPFKLKEWRRASRIVLERNRDFRKMLYDFEPRPDDAEGQAILKRFKGRTLPMVDEVDVSIIEEDQPRWLAFLNGQTDMIGTQPAPLPDAYVDRAVPGGKLAGNLAHQGIQASTSLNSDVVYALFNMEDPVFGGNSAEKTALRRAIGLAYDSQREIQLVRHGQAIVGQSRVVPNNSGYDPGFKCEMSDYSPERAKALLDVYGYVDKDGDGWRDLPDGSPLVIHMLTQGDQLSRALDMEWDRDMKAIGIRTEFQVAQWPENLKKAKSGQFQMWRLGGTAASPDGLDNLASYYSKQKGEQNMSRFNMPAFDRLYEQLAVLPDGPERDRVFYEAKRIGCAYMPQKIFEHRISTDLVHPWLIGFRRPLFASEWWQYVDLDPELRAKRTSH
jgi:ABC-type transport system substrate-binding protein